MEILANAASSGGFSRRGRCKLPARFCGRPVMPHVRDSWVTLLLVMLALSSHANTQTDQLLPEIDAYYKLNPNLRAWLQAKGTREGGDPVSAEIGPSLDFSLKSWLKLKDTTKFDLDDSKATPIIFSVGYRYLPFPKGPSENRLEPIVTFTFPMKGMLLLSDRNRADLNWKSGKFSWRYRNRLL